ncbi:unnamed protein product [Penicillium olsonii]|uniref:Protein transport protein SFT2 n=1 Tax=Penicillium olsonii TaxID=99116 RepID=A0A9W4MRM2_PENOL|nr:unnamed protein product [Penicillium olsonii]CAG7921618.1 unnamed protein product [Penicillium olsonii]CAG7986131.1 unnamed protein product [Penicillium olsonii]CAG8037234.1 unnamed protein product [Penicillium olsonii]CAG8073477.1 unnamed protein product [Penicillium olsonii]
MANNSFRDSVNSLGWSRREPDLPVHTGSSSNTPFLSRLQSYNPFGDGGYVQLPTHNEGPGAPLPAPNRREEEEGFFALSRWDRMLIFGACNLGAAVCFMICFFLFPVLSLKPRKFAVLWSVGSVLFLLSWAVLMGPWSYAKHLISGARLPFTAAYFGSIALTLYFAIGVSTSIYSDFLLSPQRTTRLGSLPFCVLARYALPRSTPTIPICYFHSISLFVAPCYTPIRKVWLHCTTGNRGILQPSRPSRGTT